MQIWMTPGVRRSECRNSGSLQSLDGLPRSKAGRTYAQMCPEMHQSFGNLGASARPFEPDAAFEHKNKRKTKAWTVWVPFHGVFLCKDLYSENRTCSDRNFPVGLWPLWGNKVVDPLREQGDSGPHQEVQCTVQLLYCWVSGDFSCLLGCRFAASQMPTKSTKHIVYLSILNKIARDPIFEGFVFVVLKGWCLKAEIILNHRFDLGLGFHESFSGESRGCILRTENRPTDTNSLGTDGPLRISSMS